MKRILEQIANDLLEAFYPSEIIGDELVEEYGIEDSNSTHKVNELPKPIAEKILDVAKNIYNEVEKDGYAWFSNENYDAVLFVKTKDGVASAWICYDTRLTDEFLSDNVIRHLSALNDLYNETISEKAKKIIKDEAKYWAGIAERLPLVPAPDKLAPSIFSEENEDEEDDE